MMSKAPLPLDNMPYPPPNQAPPSQNIYPPPPNYSSGLPPGYGGYGAPPQPAGYGAPPQPAGYGAPPAPAGYGAPAPGPRPAAAAPPQSGGLITNFGKDLMKGFNSAARTVSSAIDTSTNADLITRYMRTGAIVQLQENKVNGGTLEIVVGAHGNLIVDSKGPLSTTAQHAHWTVFKENVTGSIVKLYNNGNYLSCTSDGKLCLLSFTGYPNQAPPSTRFKVTQSGMKLAFESLLVPTKFINVHKKIQGAVLLDECSIMDSTNYFTLYRVQDAPQ